ncbi:MAG TPA: hypothetical protein VLD19_07935, partial [Chitinophagaceae bacterium]|nr:hypothetical protein [Chitinophagaceae bacterium]
VLPANRFTHFVGFVCWYSQLVCQKKISNIQPGAKPFTTKGFMKSCGTGEDALRAAEFPNILGVSPNIGNSRRSA